MRNQVHAALCAPVVLSLATVLVGCGGGGGDDAGNAAVSSGSSGTATASVAVNPVFAMPAGPLCSTTVAQGVCTQPTSSSGTAAAVMAAMRDPASPKIRFELSDVEGNTTTATLNGMPTSASISRSLKAQVVDVNRASLSIGGTAFSFDKDVTGGGERFVIDQYNYANIGIGPLGDIQLQSKYGSSMTKSGVALVNLEIDGQTQYWNTTLGLLTDQNDMPTDAQVSYSGSVLVTAGNNALVDATHWQALQAVCPITATFSPSTGVLKFAPMTCGYSPTSTPTALSFALTDLNVLGFRIAAGTGLAASIDINAPAPTYASFWPDASAAPLDLKFEVAELAGIVSGTGAQFIDVVGGNNSGEFHIQLVRQ